MTSTTRCNRGGFVYVMAIVMLAVFTTLMVAVMAGANSSVQQSHNQHLVMDARLAAESGLGFVLEHLGHIQLPTDTTEENLAANLCEKLGARLNGTANLNGTSVSYSDGVVSVPAVSVDGSSFECSVVQTGADRCRLEVLGRRGEITRRIAIDLHLQATPSKVFDYGMASRGQILISGNANISGVNSGDEASILSATVLHQDDAIHIGGNVTISGDLGVTGDEGSVIITGTPSIAGSSNPDTYADHIHFGVDDPEFPTIDTSALAALATTLVDSSTDVKSEKIWDNIRIAAGTNPNFTSKQILNGIIYIEAPNIVMFEAQVEINGFIVTEDNGSELDDCQIRFAGGVEAYGVENLPDTEEFAAVKEQTGTFILAPGFGVTFAGHVTAINGCIAADELTFTGTAEGTVRGTLIGLEDLPANIGGNVDIFIDRENADTDPVGFLKPFELVPEPTTYRELIGE